LRIAVLSSSVSTSAIRGGHLVNVPVGVDVAGRLDRGVAEPFNKLIAEAITRVNHRVLHEAAPIVMEM